MSLTLNIPTTEGMELGSHLARFADEGMAALRKENPSQRERCATCAFRKGTYPNGCAATLMNALKCAMEHEPFYCHEREGHLCAGYEAMKCDEQIKAPWDYVGGALSPLELANAH